MQVVGLTKGDELFPVSVRQIIHIPEHHYRHIIATGNLHLGNPAVRVQIVQHVAQGQNAVANPGIQHHATIDVGQEAVALFPEADQNRLPSLDVTNAQTGLATIAKTLL